MIGLDGFFPVFLIKLTYDRVEGIWGGEDPHFEFWHTYLHEIFVQQREKLELFAIQYMTCHEQGTFFLFFALLMAEFIYKLLHIAKYFVKKSQWITQIFQYSVITDCGTIKY